MLTYLLTLCHTKFDHFVVEDGDDAGTQEMIAVLYANIFKHSLALPQKLYAEAFDALTKNPDPNRYASIIMYISCVYKKL